MSAMDEERKERRKLLLQLQEEERKSRQCFLRWRDKVDMIKRHKMQEDLRLQREENELKREAERERKKELQLQKQQEVPIYSKHYTHSSLIKTRLAYIYT